MEEQLFYLLPIHFIQRFHYDPIANKISLVKGHSWSFDGEKAWRDIKERWADENY